MDSLPSGFLVSVAILVWSGGFPRGWTGLLATRFRIRRHERGTVGPEAPICVDPRPTLIPVMPLGAERPLHQEPDPTIPASG